MEFYVTKTSDWSGLEQPCAGAICVGENIMKRKIWKININTLEELCALSDAEGRIIIDTRNTSSGDCADLEIYDTWRE